ncbi:hypothetical protein ACIBSV_46275 [Embleya sp. NPDC050154]|uniref:hypothetical protein n=1 Tax=Embleya sp. NPDC050154 TaxID=3363988 RepID=UPI0037B8BFE7
MTKARSAAGPRVLWRGPAVAGVDGQRGPGEDGDRFASVGLREIVMDVGEVFGASVLGLGVRAGNLAARALYISAGFVPTGQTFGDEAILELRSSAEAGI